MSTGRYELLDFGAGRKLESWSQYVVDRPSPAANHRQHHDPGLWINADARYESRSKSWTQRRPWPPDLDVDCGAFRMPVRPTPFGHVGVFPEQVENWWWLATPLSEHAESADTEPVQALNLFAYTGASTMALVGAGYHVVHVDAAKPNVQAARAAASHNGWSDAPIRYMVDDAAKFATREVRRGRRYQTIVLDPPAYGHSPDGKVWRLERDLWKLLETCFQLLDDTSFRLLITGHSTAVDEKAVTAFLRQNAFLRQAEATTGLLIESGRSQLKDAVGRGLDAGFYVRVQSPRR